jgi:hypothetical protein
LYVVKGLGFVGLGFVVGGLGFVVGSLGFVGRLCSRGSWFCRSWLCSRGSWSCRSWFCSRGLGFVVGVLVL